MTETGAERVATLLRNHRSELLAFVRRRAGHLVDPEDIVQQAALRAVAAIDQLADPARGRSWLFRIVRNVLADELRGVVIPGAAATEPDDLSLSIEGPGDACQCALALARTLKPEYEAILRRSVLEEAPLDAVAAELGITANNAAVRLHRARRALREELRRHCGTDSLRACLGCVCDERGCCALG